jgi:hypothetical protein
VDEAAGAFVDTAAVMANLDLVISTDTAVPHLAGALGVPVWLVAGHAPDWRWGLSGADSPWYPSMRVYRQPAAGDWAAVFRQVRDDLAARTGVRPTAPAGTISIPVSPGELLDKLVICRIKAGRITDPDRLHNVRTELGVLEAARAGAIPDSPGLADLVERLAAVNERLWETEDALRECERARDFGPGFVALARSVYRTNDERARLKREINMRLGSGLFEEKSYARYDNPPGSPAGPT